MPQLITPEIPRKGDDRDASRAYTDAIVETLDPAAHNNRGVALERQGRYDEALTAFSAALLSDNEDVYAWNNRAVILTRLVWKPGGVVDRPALSPGARGPGIDTPSGAIRVGGLMGLLMFLLQPLAPYASHDRRSSPWPPGRPVRL
ncbi:MAG: TPR repeat-containing protein [Methanoculleus marisnigri]|uniref:TPR repeat-containing protein n=1 Tax=Methanoculleus marisnigri TaxID=2198 RepID=A0A124FS93_9EURY|nr:MAG: TPR repeat-containing protein [Methanoculleus marisnigri]